MTSRNVSIYDLDIQINYKNLINLILPHFITQMTVYRQFYIHAVLDGIGGFDYSRFDTNSLKVTITWIFQLKPLVFCGRISSTIDKTCRI